MIDSTVAIAMSAMLGVANLGSTASSIRLTATPLPDLLGRVVAQGQRGLVTRAVGTRGTESEVYLASVEYDEYGQRTRVEYGNGVVTKYTHDAATRRLETLSSVQSPGVGGGGHAFQALIYGYDAVGNVKSLTNALPAPLSTGFGGDSKVCGWSRFAPAE